VNTNLITLGENENGPYPVRLLTKAYYKELEKGVYNSEFGWFAVDDVDECTAPASLSDIASARYVETPY
jgi:hypothetical protein